jgi:succinoglycan biosynthesis protein ExoM
MAIDNQFARSNPPATSGTPARVAVCVATYRRREMLAELLVGLSNLVFRKMPAPEITVIVVDNDPERSAEEVCATASLPWSLKYAPESRRGIAQARNRAIREAGEVDFIAFIDDDEYPSAAWLDELLSTQVQFDADVVSGPVIPDYDRNVPHWVRAGTFFTRSIHHSGQKLDKCHTGNVLIRRSMFESISAFDEEFALTGGEDTQFFLRVRQSGFSIIGSSRAVVHESISRSRANLRWILKRAYQSGNSWVLCEKSVDPKLSTRIVRLFKAAGYLAQGAFSMPVSFFRGTAAMAHSLQTFVVGVGMLAGLAGHRYQPYRTAGTPLATTPQTDN